MKRVRRRQIAAVALVALIFGPYVYSRLAARAIRVQLRTLMEISPGNPPMHDGTNLKIAAYNIAHGRGLAQSNWDDSHEGRRARLDELAELMQQIDADVVVLNEVDFDCSWSGRSNQAEYLARKAGYRYRVEQRNLDFRFLIWTWRFGNAVLSRYPIESADLIDLPGYATWETVLAGKKRSVAVDVDFNGTLTRVVAVHLSPRSEALRLSSCEMIAEAVNRPGKFARDRRFVIAGDFNSTPTGFPKSTQSDAGSNAIDWMDQQDRLRRAAIDCDDEKQFTFRSDQPDRVIDWIYVSDNATIENHDVIDTLFSDHRPVVACINFKATQSDHVARRNGSHR